nr:retrovirus-related Pol polyprotein from transposon TNT 1-94 [Tanacetum cinerariifolium]
MATVNDVPQLVDKKGVAEIFDWDEEEVFEDEEVTQVKVLIALADDELTVGKSHARNGEWVNITLKKVNTLLSMDEDADWQNYLKLLYCMICKREDHGTSDHEMYIVSLKRSENYKAQPYQYASSSKQILKAKAKPFLSYTHYGFNDHRPDNYRNYPECTSCKFDAKADDGYFLGYSSVSKAFRVYNIRRQQIKETYHVTFDESMEAIRFTNTSVNEIGINDSSRYPPDEFFYKDDPSRQYQVDSDISYNVIPYERSLTELTQENHVPELIVPNEHDVSLTKNIEDPSNLINTEGTHKQNVQDDQMITQPIDVPSRNNTKVLRPMTEPLAPDVTQSHILNQPSTSSHPTHLDR